MKARLLLFHPAARTDLGRAWLLVAQNDGAQRANALFARLEAFCRSLGEFAEIGTRHDDRYKGLRSVGVPGLRSATVLFLVQPECVTIIRVGYLGQNVWQNLPHPANENGER